MTRKTNIGRNTLALQVKKIPLKVSLKISESFRKFRDKVSCGKFPFFFEQFFRTRHAANVQYTLTKEEMKGTDLLQPVQTRWGYMIDTMQSIIRNRKVVENAVLTLRQANFPFKGGGGG